MEAGRVAFKILPGISTGKKPLERPRHDNIRIHLKETFINTRNCIDSAQGNREY